MSKHGLQHLLLNYVPIRHLVNLNIYGWQKQTREKYGKREIRGTKFRIEGTNISSRSMKGFKLPSRSIGEGTLWMMKEELVTFHVPPCDGTLTAFCPTATWFLRSRAGYSKGAGGRSPYGFPRKWRETEVFYMINHPV